MNLHTLVALLPFAFALHNLEEVFGMEKWTKSIPPSFHKPVITKQFAIAVSLFTLLGFISVYADGLYPSESLYYWVIAGFAGMILLNVFFPHLIATIYLKKYAPGVITGILINLPLALFILLELEKENLLTQSQLIVAIVSGGLVGVILAFVFLKIGNILK
ncbi:HXXEE domain-containing protein [Flammeovirgaceae bacterium SG7u.111]|nr:HXXEE domain-containing protein [Flammeovirgaceae bacterium SG7u.132]WPO37290.1 HXXEE domain-containing protein [Flammeovirgaceae bacterium SG7u.111]